MPNGDPKQDFQVPADWSDWFDDNHYSVWCQITATNTYSITQPAYIIENGAPSANMGPYTHECDDVG